MLTRPTETCFLLWLMLALSSVACGGQGDALGCLPVAAELCRAPIAVWVEGGDALLEVVGTGACSFATSSVASGVTSVDGTLNSSGTCHIVATSTSGATDVQDVEIGPIAPDPSCGCVQYDSHGGLFVLAFSMRQPTANSSGACQCPADRYCAAGVDQCAPTAADSQCLLRPTACETGTSPVCGCDGNIYESDCLAKMAGILVAPATSCNLSPDQFACGYSICTRDAQICQLLYAPERNYEAYTCKDDLACRKSFLSTCGCSGVADCVCETVDTGAVMCRIKV